MIGLIILIVGIVYLALLIWATRFAYRWAKAKGLSKRKCLLAGAGGFLVIYLPVFWDFIPTVVVHQYYCKTEAGFWVYKTPEQWGKENPGAFDSLSPYASTKIITTPAGRIDQRNDRFGNSFSIRKVGLLPVSRITSSVIDTQKQDEVATYVDFGRGYAKFSVGGPMSWKFWLHADSCYPPEEWLGKTNLKDVRQKFRMQ